MLSVSLLDFAILHVHLIIKCFHSDSWSATYLGMTPKPGIAPGGQAVLIVNLEF